MLWVDDERETYLKESIRLEGRGMFTDDHCELCHKEGVYRCVDCFAVQFLCEGCMSRVHSFNPLHVIEVSLPTLRGLLRTVLMRW